METFAAYLLKSIIWLTGFALVYFLFLRNERYFMLKRIYLVTGILISLIFPLITIHYQVILPAPQINQFDLQGAGVPSGTVAKQNSFDYRLVLLLLYLTGVMVLIIRSARNFRDLFGAIRKAGISNVGPAKLIRASQFPASFSFFNYVFINPSVGDGEKEEIMNHEIVHVIQKHWFDLLMAEMLRLFQWVNPFAWIYTRFIRLNHEYLADETAIQCTASPANYRAALVNQLFSSPVISLSNSFNYSLNKKRFDMMKKVIVSPYRKMKILLVLPVFAIVFYAFAAPEYHYSATTENSLTILQTPVIQDKEIKGFVLKEDGTPLNGVSVLVAGTQIRTKTDASGNFKITDVPENAFVVFSYRGYLTRFIKAEFAKVMNITMQKDPDYKEPAASPEPIIVIDDVISNKTRNDIFSNSDNQIASLKSLSAKDATTKYGEKGKNGAIEIMTIKRAKELGIKVPFRRRNPEDFPTFSGERFTAFTSWVKSNLKYPEEARIKKLEGWVQVNFIVETDGTVSNVKYTGSADPILGNTVAQVVKSSPKWEPAKNPEAKEPFESSVTLKFNLPDQILDEEPFVVVEEMPMYPGGDGELLKFIAENTHYPDSAKAHGIQGRVILRFVVSAEGKTEDVTVLKGVNPLLDAEAVRVTSLISGWKPGSQGGKPVPVWYMVPVTFTLNSNTDGGNPPTTISEGKAQQEKTGTDTSKQEPYTMVEELPQYPGGDGELLKFIAENTQYPDSAKAHGIQGRVIVRFAIEPDGNVDNISVIKGVDPLLDTEAVRVVRLLKGWKPGMQEGKPVAVWYMVPITFTLK